MINLTMDFDVTVILEEDGNIRNKETLEILGKWVRVDNVIYYFPMEHLN